MKKTTGSGRLFLLFIMIILLIPGCGKQEGMKDAAGLDSGEESGGEQTTMGRYVETETDLPVQLEGPAGIYKMSAGKLVIFDGQGSFLVSENNGTSWESSSRQWILQKAADAYVMDAKMDSKGTIGMIYAENTEESDTSESMFQSVLNCVLLMPDETVIPVDFSNSGYEETIDRFWISETDRYFVTTMEGSIYEVKEDGSSELYLLTEGSPQTIQFQGNLMIIDGYDFKSPLLYDMENKEYIEDEVLEAFVAENYADRGFNGSGWHQLYLFPGEEGVIYLAGENGLHRHVIGGAAMEQIIDGRLSRLGSPQYGIAGMVYLETGEFLAASSHGTLIKFTYDPDKEAVPQERLKVYSLEKNGDMDAAVSFYQLQNPDVLVEYEIGMEEGEAVTMEDAVKKLNTKIMAGEGPDILMLDGLPMDSYIEKGILYDLHDMAEEFDGEVFENLFLAFEEEDRIYAVPGQVRFPVLLGKKSDISGLKGLSAMADGIEWMRRNDQGNDLLGLCSEKAVMKVCAMVSAQQWKSGGEGIDMDAIEAFLIQAKRIYEAQMNGLDEENTERLFSANENYTQNAGENWAYDLINYGFYMDYAAGYSDIFVGVSGSPRSYTEMISVSKVKGFEDTVLVPMEGENGRVFIPENILGINAATQKMELAEDFMKTFFGKENQCHVSGYAINKEALEDAFSPGTDEIGENGEYGKIGMIYEDGRELLLDIFIPAEEEIAVVKEWMESAGAAYIEDRVMEECIFTEGSAFILGGQKIDEALEAIEEKLAIYMTE